MTVVIVPTLLLWVLIALFALNGAASLYKMWLQRKLAAREKARPAPESKKRTVPGMRFARGVHMTPEYLEELAGMADPNSLWRLPALEALDLPPHKRAQLDAGVALRRHADHVRRVGALLGTGKSLVITPLSLNGTATMTIAAPDEHKQLLARHEPPNV